MEYRNAVQAVTGLGPGEHLCCVYGSEEEERSLLVPYLRHGLEAGGRAVCVTDRRDPGEVAAWLEAGGLDAAGYQADGKLIMVTADEVYLKKGRFDSEGTLSFFRSEARKAQEGGSGCLFVAAEMSWALRGAPGSEGLTGYESGMGPFFRENPITAVCLYDSRLFPAPLLLEALSAHPRVAMGGEVFDNFLYLEPGRPADEAGTVPVLPGWLESIREHARERDELRKSETTIQALLESTRETAALLDADGTIVYINRAAADRFHLEPGEMVGRCVYDLLPPGLAASRKARIEEVIRTGRPDIFVDERAGMVLENTVYPVPGEEGRIARIAIYARDVTEQQETQERLRASEERARCYLDLAGVMFVGLDRAGRVALINRKGSEVLGYPEEEILGRDWFADFLPEPYRDRLKTVFEAILAGEVEAFEYYENPVLNSAGEERLIAWHNTILTGVGGGEVVTLSAGEDVTEQRAMEELQEQAAREWRSTFDAMTDMIMLLGPDHRVLRANRAFTDFLGLEEEEVLGRYCYELVHGTPEPYPDCPFEAMLESNAREEMELRIEERGIWAQVLVDPIPDERGETAMIVHTIRDLTERHAAHEALRESEERYRLLLENAGTGIAYYTTDGRVVHFNRQALEHMGGRLEDYVGRSVVELYGPDFGRVIQERIMTAARTGTAAHYEDEVGLPTGRKWFSSSYAPMTGPGGDSIGAQIISTDITRLKEAEEEAQRLASIVRHSGELVNLADTEGRMVFLNEAGGKMLGLDPGLIGGKSILDVIPGHLRDLVGREIIPALRSGGAWEGELQYRNAATGELVDVHTSTFVIRDPGSGEVKYYANVSRDITEAKWAERAMRESEERLRRITDNMLDVVGQADTEGVFQYISPSCEKLLGYPPGEMLGRSIFELVHPEDLQRVAGAFTEARETLRPEMMLYRYRHALGHYIWLETSGNPLFDEAGELIGGIFTTRDVTARMEVEQRLERSRSLVSSAFEALPATICLQAPDYTIRYANRLFRETFGDPEGKKCYEVLHGRRSPCGECLPFQVLGNGEEASREFVSEDGRHFAIRYVPLTDESGEKLVLEMGVEVTERVRTIQRLRRINRCFLELGTDPRANIEMIVGAGREALGAAVLKYCASERRSRCVSVAGSLVSEALTSSAASCPVLEEGGCDHPLFLDDLRCLPEEESRPLLERYGLRSLLAVPVKASDRKAGSLCLFYDERREPTEEEEELMNTLARAVGIEEERFLYQENLRDFIDVASHELRHPITVMKGYAGILRNRDEAIDDTTREVILDIIDHGADRLNNLVEGLLDISRIERGRFEARREEQPLLPLVERALEEMRLRGFSNEFRLEVAGEPGRLELDGEKIAQLVVILVENAVKYSPSGEPVEVFVEEGREAVTVAVEDRGIGVDEAYGERVFERFFQVEDAGHHSKPGMGMGLYIARNIVEAHGGRIWCEPREGGGSKFVFTLPVTS